MREREEGGLGMVDTFRAVRGGQRKYTWRPRGRARGSGGERVDLVLVSRGLREAVVEADILNEEVERGPSDHVPLFVGLDLGRLGGKEGGSG
jgi:exonuclease III